MAERLRAAVEQRSPALSGVPVTASFGVGLYSPGDSLASLVAKADKRLYEAKHGGRNCVR
jgi:GGDEF domain-containing protein